MTWQRKVVVGLIVLAGAMWTTSLYLPAVYFHYGNFPTGPVWRGPTDLYLGRDLGDKGPLGILMGNIAWYANPIALFGAMFALAMPSRPLVWCLLALLAFVVGLDTYALNWLPPAMGADGHIERLGPAVPVWEASFLVLALSQVCALVLRYVYGEKALANPLAATATPRP